MEKRSENMTKLIELKGINKTYKNGDQELRVLKDIDLEVEEGEFVAIWLREIDLDERHWLVGPPDQRRVFPRRSGGWKSQ